MRALKPIMFAMLLATASAVTLAEPPHWRDQNSYDSRHNDRRAVRDVIGEVEQNYRGHVVDVQQPRNSEDMYRVRVLQESGRVKTLHVPAKRGHDRERER